MGIYIGNLSCLVTEEQVGKVFKSYGFVKRVNISAAQGTARSQGFAFVDMGTHAEEMTAIKALHGSNWMGRRLIVKGVRLKEAQDS